MIKSKKTSALVVLSAIVILLVLESKLSIGQTQDRIPTVYTNLHYDNDGKLYLFNEAKSEKYYLKQNKPAYTINMLQSSPIGTENGIIFDFKNESFEGLLNYGLIKFKDVDYQQPIFFSDNAKITGGKVEINLNKLRGKYDILNWEETGLIKLGYRITDLRGNILFDGKVNISGKGPFKTATSIIEGPFINIVTAENAVVSFKTNKEVIAYIEADGRSFNDDQATLHHEIKLDKLNPDTEYIYTISFDEITEAYNFRTAILPGSREAFTFAYASDCRSGFGGGERNLFGVNAYIMKKMAALSVYRNARFFQFTGDMINGYLPDRGETILQYTNWKRTIEPYAYKIPFIAGMGNHEALVHIFDNQSYYGISIDKFPFATESAEKTFADSFVNPLNGPESEDGSKYDPDPKNPDFPSYKENVFYYTFDNLAMVVLNSNYWYAPSSSWLKLMGGNLHGYIMDNQLEWFKGVLKKFENDKNIDHVFVTIHTPAFPNGGHARDDMWYYGNNQNRPYINGDSVINGIIERRDEFLDLMINYSTKVIALLTGDEHNYSRMKIGPDMPMYPDGWEGNKLMMKRSIWQITNGSAGAPYYGQETLPWSESVEIFSTEFALILFHINGEKVSIEVINADTFGNIENVELN